MGVQLITIEEFNEFRNEVRKHHTELMALLTGKMDDDKKWVKYTELKKKITISRDTLAMLRGEGKIKAQKMGGQWYYDITSFATNFKSK